jgi:hypothetical protein
VYPNLGIHRIADEYSNIAHESVSLSMPFDSVTSSVMDGRVLFGRGDARQIRDAI